MNQNKGTIPLILDKVKLQAWGVGQMVRLGRPDIALGFLGGIGDDLLCTAAIEEYLRRGIKRIWFITRFPELYHFDERVKLLPDDRRYPALAVKLGSPVRFLSYSDFDAKTDRDSPLSEHLIAAMCRKAGLQGKIALRPHLALRTAELALGNRWQGCVTFQTSSKSAVVPMQNKQWPAERFQALADHCRKRNLRCVQIGSRTDPLLQGVTDLRGTMNLRESAVVLANARLFVGLVGFLMHLARAVECPGVVIYGGREPPELTGYPCNANIVSQPPCSPCWQRNRCDFSHLCTDSIDAAQVIETIDQMLTRELRPLPVTETCL